MQTHPRVHGRVHRRVVASAPAKVNLTLRVRGRRPDGYHVLESLVGFANIGDTLTLTPANKTKLHVSGPFAGHLVGENLVLQALDALQNHSGRTLPTDISLHKNLPVAAGLGGGSADAAAALRALVGLHGLGLSIAELAILASPLGADVPVCLLSQAVWMTGIGHDVTPLAALPEADIVIVNPRRPLPTASVFQALNAPPDLLPVQPVPTQWGSLDALIEFLTAQANDLQSPAIGLKPVIGACLAALTHAGASYAAMSGSGASCFALCPAGDGAALAAHYRTIRQQDWVVAGRLIGSVEAEIDEAQ